MSHPIPPGYMTAEELRAGVHADIREHAEQLRSRLHRKQAFKKYESSLRSEHA